MTIFFAFVRRSALVQCFLLSASSHLHARVYTPDVAEFDGSSTLSFEPAESLFIGGAATIEFWVVPDWNTQPDYDPVVLSNAGPDGPSYLIAVLRDKDGLVLVSGKEKFLIPYAFNDSQLHHVAIVETDSHTLAYVDGQLQGGTEFAIQDLPSLGLWVGSADGSTAPFIGALAEIRIWGTALSQTEIANYAGRDIGDHPSRSELRASSDFVNDGMFIGQ